MGVVISSILGVIGLVIVGITSSMAASKSHDCKDAKNLEIWTAIGSFVLALILFIIMIFLL